MHKIIHIVLILCQSGTLCELPKFMKSCVNNWNLSSCSRRALEALRPNLIKGIPELDVPPIDPLHVYDLKTVRTDSRVAYYNVTFHYMEWLGGKDYKILNIFINPSEFIFRLKLRFPNLYVRGNETANGQLLSFDFIGSGIFCMNFTNVVLDIVLNGEAYISEGQEFISWEKENIETSFDESQLTCLSGFFRNHLYSEFIRLTINNAARVLVVPFRTVVEVGVGTFIIDAINRVHRKFRKNTLYRNS